MFGTCGRCEKEMELHETNTRGDKWVCGSCYDAMTSEGESEDESDE
eukprot:SAG22_NODE_906_length_6562_cov_11.249884_3_plen_46_part_00